GRLRRRGWLESVLRSRDLLGRRGLGGPDRDHADTLADMRWRVSAAGAAATFAGRPGAVGPRTCSLGPKAVTRPFWTTQTWLTAVSALGRWATTRAMPPRSRIASIASVSAASPAPSRLEFGSSITTTKGSR